MRLETRLLLVTAGILLALFVGNGTFAYWTARERAEIEIEAQAEKIRAVVMSTRRVYQRALIDSGLPWTEDTIRLLPAHAVPAISRDFRNWDKSGLTFNNVSDRPRNPANRADAVEMAAIAAFRDDPALDKVLRRFDVDGEPFYLYARPIHVEEYCLLCHGARAAAPEFIRERYDSAYDYQLGELRGILSVKLPARHVQEAALAYLPRQLGTHLGGLALAFLAISLVIRRFVRRPLDHMAKGMAAFAGGDYECRVSGVDGEFRDVATAFNGMAAEISLRHAEVRRLSQAIEQSSVMVLLTDTDGHIVYANRKFLDVTGYGLDEVIGAKPSLVKSGIMAPEIYDMLWATITDGRQWRGEMLNRRKDGTLYWEDASIAPVRGADGTITQFLAVKEDITERKLARQAAQESEERLRLLLEFTGEGIFGLDRAGRCTFANPACLRLLGYESADALSGHVIHDIIHHTTPDGEPLPLSDCRAYTAILLGEAEHSEEDVFWRRDGTSFPVEFRAHPIFRDGAVIGGVVSFTDITERRQMVDKLLRSNAELERFAYVASHDLQEPLRSVAGYAQLLQRRYGGRLDEDADTFIGYMVGGVHRMQAQINGLLAYSRLHTRLPTLIPVDCGDIVATVLLDLADAIDRADGRICVGGLPFVLGEPVQLRELFQNLIGNAVKFARAGVPPRIDIAAVRAGAYWEFAVADNGIGIAPDDCGKVFAIFQRLHTQSEYPGTGIGLALCDRIVERHGGRIWIEPKFGSGTTVRFLLRAAPEEPDQTS